MAATPLISIVIPCYNQGHFLADAVGSVGRSVHGNVEILVVDDGSTSDVAAIAALSEKVRVIRQGNAGLAVARNRGLIESHGSYVVFLDADDVLAPGALDIGRHALEAHPEAALVFGRCQMMTEDGAVLPTPQTPRIASDHYRELLKRNYIWMPAMAMLRRDAVERVGGFDPAVNASADYGLYLRIAKRYTFHDHAQVVAYYRRHHDNMSGNAARMLQESLAVLRRERPSVKDDPALLAAYYEGWRNWQDLYGSSLVDEIRAHVRSGQWIPALRKVAILAWLDPSGLRHHALRKLAIGLGRIQPAAEDDSNGRTTRA